MHQARVSHVRVIMTHMLNPWNRLQRDASFAVFTLVCGVSYAKTPSFSFQVHEVSLRVVVSIHTPAGAPNLSMQTQIGTPAHFLPGYTGTPRKTRHFNCRQSGATRTILAELFVPPEGNLRALSYPGHHPKNTLVKSMSNASHPGPIILFLQARKEDRRPPLKRTRER
eukprot:jgi/Botrbrau1/17493/Bobra.0054s0075.1